jgi:hypothetical protein
MHIMNDYFHISGDEGIDALKLAIMDFGPITTSVTVAGTFGGYDNGVYNDHSNNEVPTNHAVVLVGWDDDQGTEGVWIMRNSWGEWWGEDGYMRIEYECANIGNYGIAIEYEAGDNDGILHVPSEYPTIQEAINRARAAETVRVAPGTYTSDEDQVIRCMGKSLYVHSTDGPLVTILDGEHIRPVVDLVDSETSYTTIEGFTITNGSSIMGGGLRVDGTPNIKNCVVRNNFGQTLTGGMLTTHIDGPTLEGVIFCNNSVGLDNTAHHYGSWIDGGDNEEWDDCPCPEDLSGDGRVGVDDLLAVIADFGCLSNCLADVNADGQVTIDDLLQILNAWGNQCD